MKKWLIACIATALLLTACGGENEEATKQEKETEENAGESLNVDKEVFNVDVTLPANFFLYLTEEEIIAAAKEQGIKETVVNEDGSVTYTMSKSKYEETMKEMEDATVSAIDEIVKSEEYTSIKEISYNKDFTEFDMKVNRQQYEESLDSFAIFGLFIASAYYGAFDGKLSEDLQIIFNMIDETTGEVYDTVIYPDE
ncbi:MAG: hypothetical protein ACI33M_12615 [Lysinibacillus sp.]